VPGAALLHRPPTPLPFPFLGPFPTKVTTFGAPRISDSAGAASLAASLASTDCAYLRVEHERDAVTMLPPYGAPFGSKLWLLGGSGDDEGNEANADEGGRGVDDGEQAHTPASVATPPATMATEEHNELGSGGSSVAVASPPAAILDAAQDGGVDSTVGPTPYSPTYPGAAHTRAAAATVEASFAPGPGLPLSAAVTPTEKAGRVGGCRPTACVVPASVAKEYAGTRDSGDGSNCGGGSEGGGSDGGGSAGLLPPWWADSVLVNLLVPEMLAAMPVAHRATSYANGLCRLARESERAAVRVGGVGEIRR